MSASKASGVDWSRIGWYHRGNWTFIACLNIGMLTGVVRLDLCWPF